MPPLDFEKLAAIRFLPLVRKDFPCYDLALTALEKGDAYPCALNGAGEVAVHAFLQEKIPFTAIAVVMEETLERVQRVRADDYQVLVDVDGEARRIANGLVETFCRR